MKFFFLLFTFNYLLLMMQKDGFVNTDIELVLEIELGL